MASGRGQALLATLELQESCPELTHDALRRRQHFDESTNSFSFDLSGCSMTALPASIGSWKMSPKPLTELNLSRCTQLTALPQEIGELKMLESLNLGRMCEPRRSTGRDRRARRAEDARLVRVLEPRPRTPASCRTRSGELKTRSASSVTQLSLAPRCRTPGSVQLNYRGSLAGCVISGYRTLKALRLLDLANCTSLSALPDTINELGALEGSQPGRMLELSPFARRAKRAGGASTELDIGGCVKIESLHLDGLTNLRTLFASRMPNLRLDQKNDSGITQATSESSRLFCAQDDAGTAGPSQAAAPAPTMRLLRPAGRHRRAAVAGVLLRAEALLRRDVSARGLGAGHSKTCQLRAS